MRRFDTPFRRERDASPPTPLPLRAHVLKGEGSSLLKSKETSPVTALISLYCLNFLSPAMDLVESLGTLPPLGSPGSELPF